MTPTVAGHDLGSRRVMVRTVAFFAIAEASNKAGLVVTALIIAAALGPSGFGKWSLALAIGGVAGLLSDAGLPQVTLKSVGGGAPAREYASHAIGMKLVASAIAFIGVCLVAAFIRQPADVRLSIVILGAGMLATTVGLYSQSVFRAMAMTHVEAIARIAQQCVMIGAVAAVAVAGGGIVAYAVACAATAGMCAAVTVTALLAVVLRVAPRFDAARWLTIGRDAWPFWVATILWLAYYRVDVMLVSYFSGHEETGLYNMAYNGFQLLTMPPTVLVLALFPSFSHVYATDRPRFLSMRIRARNSVILLAIAVIVPSIVLVSPVVDIALGSAYGGTVTMFRVLAVALLFLYPNYVLMYTLAAADRQRWVTVATAVGAATNVAINLALIPMFGGMGAAAATVITESVVFAALSVMSWRAFQPRRAEETPVLEAIAA